VSDNPFNRSAKIAAEQKISQQARDFFGESTRRKFKVKSNTPKTLCPCCQKPLAARSIRCDEKTYDIGQAIPPYRGNAMLVEEHISVGAGMGGKYGEPGARVTRYTWDGTYKSASGTDPFCTKNCALKFAKMAFNAGYRVVE